MNLWYVADNAKANKLWPCHCHRDLCGEGADAKTEPRAVLPFRGGESAGRERVKYYLWDSDRLAAYKACTGHRPFSFNTFCHEI